MSAPTASESSAYLTLRASLGVLLKSPTHPQTVDSSQKFIKPNGCPHLQPHPTPPCQNLYPDAEIPSAASMLIAELCQKSRNLPLINEASHKKKLNEIVSPVCLDCSVCVINYHFRTWLHFAACWVSPPPSLPIATTLVCPVEW